MTVDYCDSTSIKRCSTKFRFLERERDFSRLVLRSGRSAFLLLVILSVLKLRQDLSRVSARIIVIGVLGCLSLCALLARVARKHVLIVLELELVDLFLGSAHDWNWWCFFWIGTKESVAEDEMITKKLLSTTKTHSPLMQLPYD